MDSIAKTITKILRFKRNITDNTLDQDNEIHKLKDDTPKREAMESLIANLFTSISAIKAAYAELQVAQSPYDPETIQSADQIAVTELKLLSELKHSYFKNQIDPPPPSPILAQIQENRNLIKTYQITTKKLESDIQHKDSEILSLQSQLAESDRRNRSLHLKLHHDHSFLAAVRYANRSVRSFAKLLVGEMESAGWDLDAAARSIQPDVQNKPGHRIFAFESFVCQRLFSDFHRRDFGLSCLEDRTSWDPQRFFAEFTEKGRSSGFGEFRRAKYSTLVHPKMEASLGSEFFAGFAELARRVWLLHCLFFSFGGDSGNSIFQVKKGCRFSEVYMESVLEEREVGGSVGFTVMPGFITGKTAIQCKVYIL